MLIAFVLILPILANCASSGNRIRFAPLPDLPPDLPMCFDGMVPAPPPGAMTKAKVLRLVAALRESEVEKSECGKRLIKYYENLKGEKE